MHVRNVDSLHINGHSCASKNPWSQKLIKYEESSRECNQPHCEKCMGFTYQRGRGVHLSRTHNSVAQSHYFFLWRRPDKTDIPEVIWADKRIFRAPAPRESSIIFHDLAFMLQKHVCSQNSAANGALHTVFKSFRNIFTGFSGKDKRVHRLPRVQK